MRYLILSDIHANLEALEAVLALGVVADATLVLGDMVGYGADPNAVIEPKFAAYEVETKDGRSLHGVVKNETATSLSVAQANGLEEKVLRSEIKKLRASTLSLMPEGLEQAIAPQDMADLIAWLKQTDQGTNLRTTATR